jgi:hypothetical protein
MFSVCVFPHCELPTWVFVFETEFVALDLFGFFVSDEWFSDYLSRDKGSGKQCQSKVE